MLSTVWNHPIQRRITLTYQPGEQHMERVAHDHDRLLDALEANDLEAALAVLRSCHDPFDHRGAPLGRSAPGAEPGDVPA